MLKNQGRKAPHHRGRLVGDGEGMVISRWDSEAAAEAAAPQIQAILGSMAVFMTSMPEVTAGEVVWEL